MGRSAMKTQNPHPQISYFPMECHCFSNSHENEAWGAVAVHGRGLARISAMGLKRPLS